ncbi:GH36-type glycosyl hydrolase domain-containing protein [Salinisphaera sp. SWV1]
MPDIQLLSNGAYHVMISAAGGGYSRWQGLALVRWREDATLDSWGTFCYLRDETREASWSTTLQPSRQPPEVYSYDFAAGRATFRRFDHDIEARTEIAVAVDADVELRRLVVTNHSDQKRTLSATSYAEIVLAPAATDSAHPAFSKLFIQTQIEPDLQAILATRRPSTPDDPTPWLFHLARVRTGDASPVSYETDRKRFIGRGRSSADPLALDTSAPLSGSAGPVLDAIAAIRVPFVLDPGASVTIDWITGIAATHEACVKLARTVCDGRVSAGILEQTNTYQATTLQALQASNADALVYARMAAAILYMDGSLRADANVIAQNRRGQSDLWKFGISGDVAIVLLRLTDRDRLDLTRQLIQAHAYWQAHGLASELAILCAAGTDHRDPTLIGQVRALVGSSSGAALLDKPDGIFVLDDAQFDADDRILLQSVARVVVHDTAGSLTEQVMRRAAPTDAASPEPPGRSTPTAVADRAINSDKPFKSGFTPDAHEYVIMASTAQMTPAPWVNVIANPDFGTLVSESGSATTWSENAHEFRLTPWSNDPVGDANTEAFYIRDEGSGHFWSPSLLPTPGASPYVTRHGFGYSVFEHTEDGIESELSIHVVIDAPIKFSVLTLRNHSDQARRLSVTGYLDWVLGDERAKTLMHMVTEFDQAAGALFARNAYNTDFAERTAFFTVDAPDADGTVEACADRGDFLGAGGSLAAPAAIARARLSGRVGAALDPCAALRVVFDLAPGQERVVVFRLGAGKTPTEAHERVHASRGDAAAQETLEAVQAYWQRTLGAVQVQTPDRELNALANGWLLYQVIASRLWGRTGFYQSSGAFGFRDQLQDVMALVHAAPGLVREHLLRAASRQFVEGDAQHWWHPPNGKGVRTHCADDFLWLPLAICRYVETTGDDGVLDESCPFLESRPLHAGEASNYENPRSSADTASLYEHAVRAIRHGLSYGRHGLPLMGSCDWNDGMNLVGAEGKGESVWMAFFLITVLTRFAPLAREHADSVFADLCEHEAQQLGERVNACGWDGGWYRRAWFDHGTVLGSAENSECRIDSIAQSWAVLSGAAPTERAQAAMDALDRHLVHRDTRLIQLLEPPFDTSKPSPGYIQGYVPGVRENGGQYTHAAVWAAMAFAALGDAERAWELLTLLNPLSHAESAEAVATYQVEPYVVAGDVYAFAPHAGRGGWTWYTGSAGWLYQLITESLLGLRRRRNELTVRPLLPKDWASFGLQYRLGATSYDIACQAGDSALSSTTLDGIEAPHGTLTLTDDGESHSIVVIVGSNHDQQQINRRAPCNSE